MRSSAKKKFAFAQLVGIVALFLFTLSVGCNAISTKGTSTSCEAKTAKFTVYEGAMSRDCGCTEGSGTFSQPSSVTCTVSLNTTVYFYFVGIGTSPHQIISSSGSTQPVNSSTSIKVGAIVMNQIGTISFYDSLSSVGGNFTVVP